MNLFVVLHLMRNPVPLSSPFSFCHPRPNRGSRIFFRHSLVKGNPFFFINALDSRFRGNDSFFVIPMKMGIHFFLDSRFRGNDTKRRCLADARHDKRGIRYDKRVIWHGSFSVTPRSTLPSVTPRSVSDEGSLLLHSREKNAEIIDERAYQNF